MRTFGQELAMIYFICAGVIQTFDWIYESGMWLDKKIDKMQTKVDKASKPKYDVRCSNHKVDLEYDKLINKILDGGSPIKIEQCYLWFSYNDTEYGVWIENKYCAYGNRLVIGNTRTNTVEKRGLRQETLDKLYEKELGFIALYGEPETFKQKEDKLIAQLLSDSET